MPRDIYPHPTDDPAENPSPVEARHLNKITANDQPRYFNIVVVDNTGCPTSTQVYTSLREEVANTVMRIRGRLRKEKKHVIFASAFDTHTRDLLVWVSDAVAEGVSKDVPKRRPTKRRRT